MEEVTFIDQLEPLCLDENLEELWKVMETSFETTISAFEDDYQTFEDFEDIFMDDKQNTIENIEVIAIDKLLDAFSKKPQNEEVTCKLCDLEFTTSASLYRHFNSKKHQRLEAVLYQKSYDPAPPVAFDNESTQQTFNFNVIMDGTSSGYQLYQPTDIKDNTQTQILEVFDIPMKGSNKFSCKFCPKKFSTNSNLRRHENLHIPKEIYQCSVCLKTFKQKEYMKKHSSIHFTRKSSRKTM